VLLDAASVLERRWAIKAAVLTFRRLGASAKVPLSEGHRA
jgi:hypothetical protein